MQIVIDIPEDIYEVLKKTDLIIGGRRNGKNVMWVIYNAVAKGTPLPKGHGRLIDADRLRLMYSINRANFNTVVGIQKWIDDAPTIIEADKAEQEEAATR